VLLCPDFSRSHVDIRIDGKKLIATTLNTEEGSVEPIQIKEVAPSKGLLETREQESLTELPSPRITEEHLSQPNEVALRRKVVDLIGEV
jgi:hypothetical protein